jgi:hypothetical protein
LQLKLKMAPRCVPGSRRAAGAHHCEAGRLAEAGEARGYVVPLPTHRPVHTQAHSCRHAPIGTLRWRKHDGPSICRWPSLIVQHSTRSTFEARSTASLCAPLCVSSACARLRFPQARPRGLAINCWKGLGGLQVREALVRQAVSGASPAFVYRPRCASACGVDVLVMVVGEYEG